MKLTLLLGALVALPALGVDFFVPALPVLAAALDFDAAAAQLTVTAYFVGISGGLLLWGPLSDRFGRKPVLLAGLAAMLVSSLAAALMASAASLAAARLAQGLAMASGAVISRSVVRDLYQQHEQAAGMLSRMMIVFSIVPICAPVAGALISQSLGWQAVFASLAAIAATLAVLVGLGLAETAPAERRSAHPLAIARTFAEIVREPRFRAPFLLVFCGHMGILAWVSSSAFTLVRGMGVPTVAYGFMFALVALGQICGAALGSRLVVRLGGAGMMRLGVRTMAAAGAAAALLAWTGVAHWTAVVLPFAAFLFGTAMLMPSASAAALMPFPRAAGTAASLMGAIGFASGALVSTLLGAAFDGTARPMASVAASAGILSLVLHRVFASGKA